MDLNKIIERKDSAAQYMVDEITYICKNLDKRSPGSEGGRNRPASTWRKSCGRIADATVCRLKPSKKTPAPFFGWIYFTITAALFGDCLLLLFPACLDYSFY